MGRPTIEEVALRAGVSRGTASRVINGAAHVSADAREKVLRAVDELRYVPSRAARSLVTQRNDTVALAISNVDPRLFSDHPFFSEVILGIDEVLAEADLELTLVLGTSQAARDRLSRRLSSRRVDGVMLLSLHGNDPLYSLVEHADIPIVFGGKPLGIEPDHYVDADNRGGARQAVAHLVRTGRRRIATITGPQDMDAAVARFNGFRDALGEARLEDHRVAYGDFSEASASAAMAELLERFPDLDAVFAAADAMAAAAMRVLAANGRRVPEDVAVVGFDDRPAALHLSPPLTTVHQPIRALGTEMARMLVALVNGRPATSLILPTRLVVRGSA
ncbi:LacI family DNA-binding transcriptional regulator [Fodinicola acaciae]|uniref:LacI family DNA-binding transcriptional regulator n=1 Tax=Fodinicola acaciae TaxID=2681555 RepID=UPI001C9E4204|nr:LacI family DNA-binding transcriptional regulator [Fodinicola acaciae]